MINFCPTTRKGANEVEMTELMIVKWNEQVAPNDKVYHLGDMSFADTERTEKVLARLNGQIHLIKGNHDKWLNHEIGKRFVSVKDYMVQKIDSVDVVMFHFPIIEWDKMHRGSFHLFGHVHGKDMRIAGRAMDVGVDTRKTGDMGLYSWDEIRKYMKDRPILSHH
jgi:calcineurin-like phosphoesterase family protein